MQWHSYQNKEGVLKKSTLGMILFIIMQLTIKSMAAEPSWEEGIAILKPRSNPYYLNPSDLREERQKGLWHAHHYPVAVTGMLPPYRPIKNILNDEFKNPIKKWLNHFFKSLTQINSFDQMMLWLGLNEFPKDNDPLNPFEPGAFSEARPKYIGVSTLERQGAQGFTLSCAVCHTSQLFGRTVVGLTNRFPRANEFFVKAQTGFHFLQDQFFKQYAGATSNEMALFREAKLNIKSVGLKKPINLGLDTSLAQVSLSLSRRNQDELASKNSFFEENPRADLLESQPADSKPAVWWNLKYKNRWLSDGSVVSGNPIYTNILWNEIGRGADLEKLEMWLQENEQAIKQLTTAVFSIEAPKFVDFFSEEEIDISSAQRGEVVFNEHCSRCHGTYIKNWSLPEAQGMSLREKLLTFEVKYPQVTKVKDVGTDAFRYLGMSSLTKLNELAISKKHQIIIKPQKGYVPPPLVGIWARWPYLHNNSIPSLCALLTPASQRPKWFYQGPANNSQTDFDKTCNGYPQAERAPISWKKNRELIVDTTKRGLGNFGHDEGIITEQGKELLLKTEKMDLIRYLQTL